MTNKASKYEAVGNEGDRQMLINRQLVLNEAARFMNDATAGLLHTPEPPRHQEPIHAPVSAYVAQGSTRTEQHANQAYIDEGIRQAQQHANQQPRVAAVPLEASVDGTPVYTGTAEQVSNAQAAVDAAFGEAGISDFDSAGGSEDAGGDSGSSSEQPEYAAA